MLPVDDAAIVQRDGFALLQALEQWPWFHAVCQQRSRVERAGLIMLFNTVAVARNGMVKRCGSDFIYPIIKD
ncbi:Uncharacterised protein [Enterobacter cancerogenus]|uniref:Uncharacterized protein n=1 Tax=Enterobacter cancerogenus TaxID=69218 RepID=A0A484Z7E2_9ENTR|nr:Uncharacterised protein [Enterobacter cancerogenus]